MSDDYNLEKLNNAVAALAASAQTIQQRLVDAWMAMHTLQERDFADPEIRQLFNKIDAKLKADKSDSENGYVKATCSKLSDHEAEKIADLLVSLHHRFTTSIIWKLEDELDSLKKK